ncbi:DNA-methyltransferase [Burkholderia multivorans]|uniref:DNA-methyltransferase n=1 Tax=Burkholderia multivorans TaxID=87883 RepID=UPI001C248B27|nr:site-specific DNA-methyltransferase [Burkholderia multivorans]MBU9310899.1 site-specific DNA-methyltransferase [Burkholderia multivorans]
MKTWIDRCHFGDCRDLMPQLPEAIADAIVTDPPYGDTSLLWDKRCEGWTDHIARILKPAASVWVFGSMRFIAALFADMERVGFRYAQDIVWEKQNGSGFAADRFRRVHEHAVQFYRGAWADVHKEPQFTMDAKARVVKKRAKDAHWHGATGATTYVSEDGGPRLMRSVIDVANEHGKAIHPTQKPLGILAPLIAYSVPPGGVVLDPFMGSGSTGIAARQLGRHFIGFEDNPECFDMQAERSRQSDLALA